MSTHADPIPPLTARLLGPVRIAVGERVLGVDAWPRRSARSLLLLLLATPGHRLPREGVLDRLWPDADPARAANALYQALHGLRRVLEPTLASGRASSYVEADRDSVALREDPGLWTDVDAMERALDRVPAAGGDERSEALRAALDLYAGDLLAHEPGHEWAVVRRERLRRRRRDAVLALADHALAGGDPGSVVADLERVTNDDPSDEAVHRALMRAFAAAGRRDRALRQYEHCRDALRDDLDVAPDPETEALRAEIAAQDAPTKTSAATARAPSPATRFAPVPAPPNALVGRDRELAALADLLWEPGVRLITVTGPGGVGKTRLAQEAARRLGAEFDDGVGYVALAAVRDPAFVLPAVARALGAEDIPGRTALAAVAATIGDGAVLLVLDNLEQVVAAGPDLAAVLDVCPRLTLLTTSREPLHLRAEHEFPTPPLAIPGARWPSLAALARSEAVDLFARRMRAVRPDFVLADANAVTVAELCARLDGLPLALELAAARGRSLSPEQMLAGLADRFALLADGFRDLPPRQRTIRDAISWSYDLLSAPEQALARRLSVFVGGCTIEDAAAVIGRAGDGKRGEEVAARDDPAACQAALDALVEKSWARWERSVDGIRFSMLETIREFGLERLAEHDEVDALRRAHAGVFLDLAERADPELVGPGQAAWLDRLQRDHANLGAAMSWATAADDRETADVALRMAAALHRYWRLRGYLTEGRARLKAALAHDGDPDARANALRVAGDLASDQGDNAEAIPLLEAAIATWRASGGRPIGLARTLAARGQVAHEQGDFAHATALHAEALALSEEHHDRWGIAQAHASLGNVAYYQGDLALTETYWMAAVDLFGALGDRANVAAQLGNLANFMIQRGELDRARDYCEQALTVQRQLDLRIGMAISIVALGGVAQAQGDFPRAIARYEESIPLFRDLRYPNGEAVARHNLGVIALETGDLAGAMTNLAASLSLLVESGDRARAAMALESLARVHGAEARWERSARLLGAAAALWDATGASRDPNDEATIAQLHAAARDTLGADAFDRAHAAGRALPPTEAAAGASAEAAETRRSD